MKRKIFAVSGVKNSGKTSLISKMIPKFKEKGLSVATIKHDGHNFLPDVSGTDSFIYRESGADAVAIFSDRRFMIIKEERDIEVEYFINEFKDYDLIILEGFKFSSFPKLEVIRSGISKTPVSDKNTVMAYVSDLDRIDEEIEQFDFCEIDDIVRFVLEKL